jgi:hypothetical protein
MPVGDFVTTGREVVVYRDVADKKLYVLGFHSIQGATGFTEIERAIRGDFSSLLFAAGGKRRAIERAMNLGHTLYHFEDINEFLENVKNI